MKVFCEAAMGKSMEINEKIIDKWIAYGKSYFDNYELPVWDNIPDFGLYMEQVVTYLRKELKYLDKDTDADCVITAPAINNYVRKKFMPQPIKKRYYRTHLAYLLILCALKPSLSISEIQALIPMDTGEEELHLFYDAFRQQHKRSAEYFISRIERLKKLVVKNEFLGNAFKDPGTEIVVDIALLSSFTKLFSDKLLGGNDELSEPSVPSDDTKTP